VNTMSTTTTLHYRNETSFGDDGDESMAAVGWGVAMKPRPPSVDVSAINHQHRYILMDYFDEMKTTVKCSTPHWIHTTKDGLLTCSPAEIIEKQINEVVFGSTTPMLVEDTPLIQFTEPQRTKFDFDWRYAFMRMVSSNQNNPDEYSWMLKRGESNSHPLRFQLIYIPPFTSLTKHIHASFEFNVPLLGALYERRGECLENGEGMVPAEMLQRNFEHTIGSPLNELSEVPTWDDLKLISGYLSERVQGLGGMQVNAEENVVNAGDCLMNPIGSYHEGYTKEEPCLMLAFGSNVHARL